MIVLTSISFVSFASIRVLFVTTSLARIRKFREFVFKNQMVFFSFSSILNELPHLKVANAKFGSLNFIPAGKAFVDVTVVGRDLELIAGTFCKTTPYPPTRIYFSTLPIPCNHLLGQANSNHQEQTT